HLYLFEPHTLYRDLHSFPTRRSSDLDEQTLAQGGRLAGLFGLGEPRGVPGGFDDGREIFYGKRSGMADLGSFGGVVDRGGHAAEDRKSTRLNSSHVAISYAVFCLKKK